MANIKIYIPSYIGSVNYDPVRTLPHLYFYNGQVDCQPWWVEGQFYSGSTVAGQVINNFPYFDHYNVVTGSFPTADSQTLLFNNEEPVYGSMPTGSLYSEYWANYVGLLYNPYTRLIDASAIIPLADYAALNLNDIVEWRGNMYHLRAINNYSVKTGECSLQLLGPIIRDTFGIASSNTPTTTTTTTTSTTTTSTTTTSTTTTSTTTTTTTEYPGGCESYQLTNNTSLTIYWSAQNCVGQYVGGSVTPGQTTNTACLIPGTYGASGTLTKVTYYC